MKIIKIGKFTFARHWFRWYFVQQEFGGSEAEHNWLTPIDFTGKE
jgi:hypothetical protein